MKSEWSWENHINGLPFRLRFASIDKCSGKWNINCKERATVSGLYSDKLNTTAEHSTMHMLPLSLIVSLSLSLFSLVNCGESQAIEIALQLSLIKLQLCHKNRTRNQSESMDVDTERESLKYKYDLHGVKLSGI